MFQMFSILISCDKKCFRLTQQKNGPSKKMFFLTENNGVRSKTTRMCTPLVWHVHAIGQNRTNGVPATEEGLSWRLGPLIRPSKRKKRRQPSAPKKLQRAAEGSQVAVAL